MAIYVICFVYTGKQDSIVVIACPSLSYDSGMKPIHLPILGTEYIYIYGIWIIFTPALSYLGIRRRLGIGHP